MQSQRMYSTITNPLSDNQSFHWRCQLRQYLSELVVISSRVVSPVPRSVRRILRVGQGTTTRTRWRPPYRTGRVRGVDRIRHTTRRYRRVLVIRGPLQAHLVLEVPCAGLDVCETAPEKVFSTAAVLRLHVVALVEVAGPGALQAGSKATPTTAHSSVESRQAVLPPTARAYRRQCDCRLQCGRRPRPDRWMLRDHLPDMRRHVVWQEKFRRRVTR